jgi:GH15 family glucan-1,4-alpha-glucosidase
VRFGNHASAQKQLGMYGFLAHCAVVYLRHGGAWRPELFELIARCADHVAAHWSEPDNGIWELSKKRDHVSSRVMCWVALTRAAEIADATNQSARAHVWREQARAVHAEVLERGYDRQTGSFRQAYGSDAIDASALLIPIMGFLKGDDPRVVSTVDRVARELTIEGHVHRFVPQQTPGVGDLPMGEYEGSFLLCTSWLASAYACGGRLALAEATLARVEAAMTTLGLLSEGIDARSGELLGNFPLLFSHAEYLRAVALLESRELFGTCTPCGS